MTYKNATRPEAAVKAPLTASQWAKVQKLYDDGKLDLDIAEAVGCASKTIARWRWRNGYERNDRV